MRDENPVLKLSGEVVLSDGQRYEELQRAHKEIPDYMDVESRVLGTGDVSSNLTGNATITKEDVIGLYTAYNRELEAAYDSELRSETKAKRLKNWLKRSTIEDFLGKDIRTDHNTTTVNAIVGRIKGTLKLEGNPDNPELWANIRVLGKENVIKVADTRYTRLSVGFSRAPYAVRSNPSAPEAAKLPFLKEISFVQIGAFRPARVEDSQLRHPVLLSGNEDVATVIFPTEQREIIKLVYDQINLIDLEMEKIDETLKIQAKLNYLATTGRVLPRYLKNGKLLKNILNIKDKADRNVALELLAMQPTQVCLSGTTNSSNALMGVEMIMSADNNVAKAASAYIDEVNKQFDGMSEAQKRAAMDKIKAMRKEADIKLSGPSMTQPTHAEYTNTEFKFEGDNAEDQYLSTLEQLMGEGKLEEAKSLTASYKEHKLRGTQPSEAQQKAAEATKLELSGYKEELKVLLSGLITEKLDEVLEIKLSGISESIKGVEPLVKQHEELVAFVNSITASINNKTQENKE